MSLTTLSPELVSHVVASIESRPALCNLARCSRQLYLCTIPHLYRHVKIEETVKEGRQENGRLRTLASLLIQRSDLAGFVRQFTLHVRPPKIQAAFYHPYSEELEEHIGSETVEVDQAFRIAVNALALSVEDDTDLLRRLSQISEFHHDLILALLLPALLKVEKLVLDLEPCYKTNYLEQTIQRAARRERPFDVQPPFEALTVFVHSPGESYSRGLAFLASLLKLPAVQEISAEFGDERGATEEHLIELVSSSSPLTSLDLATSSPSRASLGHMLRAPKALKTMICKIGYVKIEDLRHALGTQENCLERLDLDADGSVEDFFENYGFDLNQVGSMPMVSFVSFNRLKIFKTPVSFLDTTVNGTGRHNLINIFPPNLETLHLIYIGADSLPALEAVGHLLAQKAPQQIPSLRKVILETTLSDKRLMQILWTDSKEAVIARLSRTAAARSVSIEVFSTY